MPLAVSTSRKRPHESTCANTLTHRHIQTHNNSTPTIRTRTRRRHHHHSHHHHHRMMGRRNTPCPLGTTHTRTATRAATRATTRAATRVARHGQTYRALTLPPVVSLTPAPHTPAVTERGGDTTLGVGSLCDFVRSAARARCGVHRTCGEPNRVDLAAVDASLLPHASHVPTQASPTNLPTQARPTCRSAGRAPRPRSHRYLSRPRMRIRKCKPTRPRSRHSPCTQPVPAPPAAVAQRAVVVVVVVVAQPPRPPAPAARGRACQTTRCRGSFT